MAGTTSGVLFEVCRTFASGAESAELELLSPLY